MSTQIDRPTYNECRKIITRVFKKLRHKRFGFWAYQNFSSDDWCGWMRLRHGGLINLDGVECIARAAALRRTYESGAMKLIEIYDLVMSKLLAGGYRVIFGDEFMQGRLSEHRVFVDVFMQEALSCGVNGFLYHIETTENYWPVIQDAILSGDVHVHQNSMHWVLCRDSTLLMPIYHEWRDSGLYDDEDGVMFIDLFIKYGSKRRSELVQKIGSILDENTSVLKENDYRVCMDALKDLM